jgi:hypothetical protein
MTKGSRLNSLMENSLQNSLLNMESGQANNTPEPIVGNRAEGSVWAFCPEDFARLHLESSAFGQERRVEELKRRCFCFSCTVLHGNLDGWIAAAESEVMQK